MDETEIQEEETHAPNDAVILSYSQTPVEYKTVPKVWLTHPDSTEEAPVLVPFTYGEAVSKTVAPDFSGGDMQVPIAEGELVTELAIVKPETLVPENIAKDVVIAGITGTHSGGGDSEGVAAKDVNFYDCDGTILYSYTVAEANALTALPDIPVHDDLVSQGWNYSLEDVQNTTGPLEIGAMYNTTDGKTHIHINLTDASTLKCFLWCIGDGSSRTLAIEWGDGTTTTYSAASHTASSANAASHTYASIGQYCIKIKCSYSFYIGNYDGIDTATSGCSVFGSGSGCFGNAVITKVHLGNNAKLSPAAFSGSCMDILTMPKWMSTFIGNSVYGCYCLKHLTIPNSVATITGTATVYTGVSSLSIPKSVAGTIKIGSFCGLLERLIIPSGITTITAPRNIYSMNRIVIPAGVTKIDSYFGQYGYSLKTVDLPEGLATIGDYVLDACYALKEVTIPEGTTTIGTYFARYCRSLERVILPSTITSVGTCFLMGVHKARIYVPDDMVDTFKSMTNLTSLAEYILPRSTL